MAGIEKPRYIGYPVYEIEGDLFVVMQWVKGAHHGSVIRKCGKRETVNFQEQVFDAACVEGSKW